jgi:DNA replication factor GINS
VTDTGDRSTVLDGLQLVVTGERDAVGTLTALPPDLLSRAGEEVGALRKVFAVCTDPMTEPFRTATERIDALQQHLDDLVRMRSQKILLLALLSAEGRSLDREHQKRMLPAEQVLYDDVQGAVDRYRQAMIGGLITPSGVAADGPVTIECAVAAAAAMGGHDGALAAPLALARVLSPVEPFLGFDGRTYALQAEDVVTLPPENAAVLRERNIIMNILPERSGLE